jgi:hypothetical protein
MVNILVQVSNIVLTGSGAFTCDITGSTDQNNNTGTLSGIAVSFNVLQQSPAEMRNYIFNQVITNSGVVTALSVTDSDVRFLVTGDLGFFTGVIPERNVIETTNDKFLPYTIT